MAKLTLTLAGLLFVFAFAHARVPSDLDAEQITTVNTDAAEKYTNTLLLPSEKRDEPTDVESEPEKTAEPEQLPEAKFVTVESNEELTDSAEKTAPLTVPLTVISFRTAGRHFPRRPFPLSAFRQRHRCGGKRGQRKWSPRFHGGEVHYGNDMILSSGEKIRSDPASYRDLVRQIPPRWINFRHGGPRIPLNREEMDLERPHHHHHHHHGHHDEVEGEENLEHRHEHRHEHGGLLRTFRKFLNRF